MGSITDYMFDTSIIEEVLDYLKSKHNIHSVILDTESNIVPIGCFTKRPDRPAAQHIPFTFEKKIGGLFCAADSTDILEQADPHIHFCLKNINALLERELQIKQATDEILQLSAQLNFLYNLANKLIGINNLQDFCTIIMEEISKVIHADQGFVRIQGARENQTDIQWNISAADLQKVVNNPVFQKKSSEKNTIFSLDDGSSVLSTPLREKDGVSGNLVLVRHAGEAAFSAYDKKFLGIIDNIISPTIETLRLYDSLQELYVNTVKALAMAIDAKDQYTHGHSYRVARYSVAIGRKLKVADASLNDLEIAAYMHDLGKIGIAESILGKPAKLTDEEYDLVKKHPEMTDKILEPIHLPAFIVDAAVQHHERLDGRGYPYGLKGDSICAFARIIAVADVFDAMTSARPYRDAMPVEKALDIICQGAGREFDVNMVLALIESLQEDDDPEIKSIYRDLSFADVHGLNDFLIGLNIKLAPQKSSEKLEYLPEHCKPLLDKSAR